MPLSLRRIEQTEKTLNTQTGSSIASFLIYISIALSITAMIMKLEMTTQKNTRWNLKRERAENNLTNCLATFINANQNNSTLNGISTTHWHQSLSDLNATTRTILQRKGSLRLLKPTSPILEIAKISLPIYRLDLSNRKTTTYLSHHGSLSGISKNSPNLAFSNLLILNPWSTLAIQARINFPLSKDKLSENKIILLRNEPRFLTSFGSLNFDGNSKLVLSEFPWAIPLASYGVIFLTTKDTIEFESLISEDHQPYCNHISFFEKAGNSCKIGTEIQRQTGYQRLEHNFECQNIEDTSTTRLEALEKWQ